MADDDNLYHHKDGSTTALNTADALDSAVSDLSLRLSDVETKPAGTQDSGDTDYRLARLEAVLVEYFFSQFQRYDADHPKPAPATTTGEPSSGSAGT